MGIKKPSVRNREERNKLAEKWLRLVPYSIHKMEPTLSWLAKRIGYADAHQLGCIALIRAAELWEEDQGEFSTYAVAWIRHAMFKYRKKQLAFQLASDIPVDLEELPDRDLSEPIEEDTSFKMLEALRILTPRERRVLELRFALTCSKPLTLMEVGKEFGLNRERVRQIEATALRKLRRQRIWNVLIEMIDWTPTERPSDLPTPRQAFEERQAEEYKRLILGQHR